MPAQPTYSEKILPILRRTRKMLLPRYGNVTFRAKTSVRKFDTVTALDARVEKFLKTELAAAYPAIPFVGEETGGDRKARTFWLVDPIDGTSYFIRGLPFCTTMVALIENKTVIFSAVYDFVRDLMYSAEKGRGAFENGKRIRVSGRKLSGAFLAWETRLNKEKNLRWYMKLRKKSVLIRYGCAGFEYAMVAAGKLDGRICIDPYGKDYDFAPGAFLVSEAGGAVANVGKKTYDYRNLEFIAAAPRIFRELTRGKKAIFPLKPESGRG